MMNFKCPYCNNLVGENYKFCDKCGATKDDTFEYVPNKSLHEYNNLPKEDTTIKESLLSSMLKFGAVFLLYFLVFPNLVAFIYIFLSILFPSAFPDVSSLSDSKYMLLNMSLGEIANVLSLIVIFIIIINNKRIKEFFGPRKPTKGQTFLNVLVQGLLTFVCMYGIAIFLSLITMFFPSGDEVNANQGLIEAFIHDYPFFGFISVAIMAPLVEELVFRFLLCKPIEQKYKWLGVAISAFVFGAIHLVASVQEGTLLQDLPSLITYVGMGAVLGVRYKMSDNIASNMLAHGLYNTVSFMIIMFM